MQPADLLNAAKVLLSSSLSRPSSACRRRAMSTVYYAMFHCLARECADLMIGSAGADRSIEAWQQVYRSLDHGTIKNQCAKQSMMRKFPKQVEDFANLLLTFQEKRHRADYDPLAQFSKSEISNDVLQAERAIAGFKAVPTKHRRAFCAYVLLKQRG